MPQQSGASATFPTSVSDDSARKVVAYNEDPLYCKLQKELPKVDLHTHLNGSISNACLSYLGGLLYGPDSSTAKVFQHKDEEGPLPAHSDLPKTAQEDSLKTTGTPQTTTPTTTTALFISAATEMGGASVGETLAKKEGDVKASADVKSDGQISSSSGGGLPADPAARMHYCFAVFDAIYKIMNNMDFTRVACQDILFHYLAERAVYVEIRTSIRGGMHMRFADHKAAVEAASISPSTSPTAVSGVSSTQWDYWKTVTETINESLTLVDMSSLNNNNNKKTSELLLPSYVSLEGPEFATVVPSSETLVRSNAYVEGLKLWADQFEGRATFVGSFILDLADEAALVRQQLLAAAEDDCGEAVVPSSSPAFPCVRAVQNLKVRMLLSISRGQSIADSEATAAIIPRILEADARALQKDVSHGDGSGCSAKAVFDCTFPLLVGIDLGGSAYKGHLPDILALLTTIRKTYNLPITLHGGEKKDDAETEQMISFGPERWGHLVFISDAHRDVLQQEGGKRVAAVELCLTSNMITSGSDDVSEHHISSWIECKKKDGDDAANEENHDKNNKSSLAPFVIVFKGNSHISLHTDDRGVFSSSLTRELWLFTQHTELFSTETFGAIGSVERCDSLFPIVKAFHRKALEVIFTPPSLVAVLGGKKKYIDEATAHFDSFSV